MRYLGGKSRIAKEIVSVLEYYRKPKQVYMEPFVGGANIVSRMSGDRIAYDIHPELIEMYKALQNGWIPPDVVTEEMYQEAKEGKYDPALTAFIGFGCSFGGKYFGGYARDVKKPYYNYALGAKTSLLKKIHSLKNVYFKQENYKNVDTSGEYYWQWDSGYLIYCDPPYASRTGYSTKEFDHDHFWNWVRLHSKNNTVIVSEYTAPEDFKCIWQKETRTQLRNNDEADNKRVEKLFMLKS